MVNSEERLAQTKSPPSTFKSFVSDTEAEQQPGVLSMFTQSRRASVSSNSCLTRFPPTYEGQSNYADNLSSTHPCIRTQSYQGFEQCRIVPLRVCAELSLATNAMRKTLINKQCLNWPERIQWCVGSTPGHFNGLIWLLLTHFSTFSKEIRLEITTEERSRRQENLALDDFVYSWF